jgi:hypothetical protein
VLAKWITLLWQVAVVAVDGAVAVLVDFALLHHWR